MQAPGAGDRVPRVTNPYSRLAENDGARSQARPNCPEPCIPDAARCSGGEWSRGSGGFRMDDRARAGNDSDCCASGWGRPRDDPRLGPRHPLATPSCGASAVALACVRRG